MRVPVFLPRSRAGRAVDVGADELREHYRAQLVRQHELSRDGWKFVLPFAPGFGLIIFARVLEGRPASQVVALIVLAVATFVGVLWTIDRSARKLEREIAALE